MILAMNLLVAAVGSAVGYVGIEAATSQVAQRLVHESARNAADLFSAQNWPRGLPWPIRAASGR